ncbi:hypothetical protein [Loktanella atrilutea]|uniref:hypothetical protein n=1 Tax=Loktanella atrilutea TaxID=366533 RepID=UPI000A01F71D|nr:hypothetical protein [Loktanella atrilutea]
MRLTLLLLAIFAVSALGCLAVAYAVTKANIESTIEAELRQTISEYRAINDNDDLLERLSDAAAQLDPDVRILHYLPDRGTVLSNVADFPPVSGVTIIAANAISTDVDGLADS